MLIFKILFGYLVLLFKILFVCFIMRMIYFEIVKYIKYNVIRNKKNNE